MRRGLRAPDLFFDGQAAVVGPANAHMGCPAAYGMGRQETLPGGSAGRPAGSKLAAGAAREVAGAAPPSPATPAGAASRTVGIEALLGRRLAGIEAKGAPPVVHVAGPMPIPLPRPRVSVVGSRCAPAACLDAARAVSRALSAAGAVVVSGLAAGVDAAAHRAAIDAGGRTVAVLGTPLDRSYPAANAGLQAEIARGHLAVSQFAAGSPVARSNFVVRNRTMALLSDATVIAGAAGASSGTRHAGRDAIRLGRPLFIHRSAASAAWVGGLLDCGAVLVDGPGTVVDAVRMRPR